MQKASSVIAYKNGKLLIVHKPREQDAWQFPQGKIEKGETEIEAAEREFLEELGTNKIKITCQSNTIYKYKLPNGEIKEIVFFLAQYLGQTKDIKLQKEELNDYMWTPPAKLPKYFIRKEYLAVCLEAIKKFKI